ncbi:MAG: type IX secretion system sortase PorU [Bacteroidales bacterium]|nr:type IX secretion system sortase PorU [Bacteroidales bacterium]
MKKIIFKILMLSITVSPLFGQEFAENSILKSGKWYKIKVAGTGIYKLSYSDIKELGFDTPENIRIYGNMGRQLSYTINGSGIESDDLEELPIYSSALAADFGEDDYYLFFAQGTENWVYNDFWKMFEQSLSSYATENYYYITSSFGPGQRIESIDYSSLASDITITTYRWRGYYEEELYNLINSGRQWYGEKFNNSDFSYTFNIKNLISGNEALKLKITTALRSGSAKDVYFSLNDNRFDTVRYTSVNIEDIESIYARPDRSYYILPGQKESYKINLSADNPGTDFEAYVDHITLTAEADLSITSYPFFFRTTATFINENINNATFIVKEAASNTQVWDVTDFSRVHALKGSLSGNTFTFKTPVADYQEFVAVDPSKLYPAPIFNDEGRNDLGWIDNQNLHAMEIPELLIVTHPLFVDQANELADLHRQKDAMKVSVVKTDLIYNEFSSGKADACAIRNFARMLYTRSGNNKTFKYLLLFGDGTYDNRNYNVNNTNYIPTYQSIDSRNPGMSYTSDDLFGMLEVGEWVESGTLDIGVGRLPVKWNESTKEYEAQKMVDKIKLYYGSSLMRDWRNNIIFLADDGESGWDSTVFMKDSDILTETVKQKAPGLNINKIYLDAYTQISSSTGASYPEVEKAIIESFKKGALVFNYMGHGGENGITQEKVFQKTDMDNLTNSPYFPLFITATCQVSRFDNVIKEGDVYSTKVSAGESVLLNPNGGAIALYTTTRVVYQSSNMALSERLYEHMFEKDDKGKRYRLGDLFRMAKNESGGENKLKFALLGDPAIMLPYGEYIVVADSINHKSVDELSDSISALEKVTVSGHVAYDDSTLISDFNGIVQFSVFDKAYIVTTRSNDGIPKIDFELQDKLLYRGKASVINGYFTAAFIVPKDISYNIGAGKMSFYAQNGIIDAKGYTNDFLIGGTSSEYENDVFGPDIQLYMNNESFQDGGITSPNPVFLAHLFDEHGINTTGNGIGHDLSAVLDDDYMNIYNLNNFYEGNLDDYQRGEVRYPLSELSKGQHTIKLKVWDNYNNSAEEELNFYVENSNHAVIEDLFNYPNPMSDYTYFQYTHNLVGEHTIVLDVFDLSGKKIYTVNRTNYEGGFVSTPLEYNLTTLNGEGLQPGVYPYRITLRVTPDNSIKTYEAIESSRLIIIP